jgi:hypothetical protein
MPGRFSLTRDQLLREESIARSASPDCVVAIDRNDVITASQWLWTTRILVSDQEAASYLVALLSTASTDFSPSGLAAFCVRPSEAASIYSRSVLGTPLTAERKWVRVHETRSERPLLSVPKQPRGRSALSTQSPAMRRLEGSRDWLFHNLFHTEQI